MSDKSDGKADGTTASAGGTGTEVEQLTNALRLEKAKNEVLLGEVIALEDEVVNRAMADYDAVVSDETREFWREQLLTNRAKATVALTELARARGAGPATSTSQVGAATGAAGASQARRPLHNRAVARPLIATGVGGGAGSFSTGSGTSGNADDRAAKIRNRAHEISKADRVTFTVAFRRAELEIGV